MRPCARTLAAIALCSALAATANAQSFATHPCPDKSEDHGLLTHFFGGSEQACELRSTTFPLANGRLNVTSQNGAIELIGEDRPDVALEARVSVHAGSESEAANILHQITISIGGTVEAHGPHPSGNRNWSVGYKLHVPRHLAAYLRTMNGGISLNSIDGNIHGETTNGGIEISRLAGDVHLTTTNGGIHATLEGPTWHGTGLEAATTNGGVSVSLPSNYSAHLVASTVNGGISLDVPSANQNGVHHHDLDTNLGSGGPTLHFETVNGGVAIH
jgi:hypothetical protein